MGAPPLALRLEPTAHRVRWVDGVVEVPLRYEVHWRRFATVPTELVREAAYTARRRAGDDEADAAAFAEAFVRDEVLGRD